VVLDSVSVQNSLRRNQEKISWFLGAVISGEAEEGSDSGNQIPSFWERRNVMALLHSYSLAAARNFALIRSGELKDYYSYEIIFSCEEALVLLQTICLLNDWSICRSQGS